MYSWDVAERLPSNHALGRVLTENVAVDDPATLVSPWRKFFDTSDLTENANPVTHIIAVEATKLREKWVGFQKSCAKEERLDLEVFEPTVESVFDLVTSLNATTQAKRKSGIMGKVMTRFHKFCDKLDSHAQMLKVLPDGNEYVSIFTGTLTAIINASVNHERVAEELAEALCTISENVAECQAELEIFRTTAMLERVADLYAHVFIFLSSYMDWAMRKRATRLLDSFNENLFRKFEPDIKKITDRSDLIRRLVAQSSRAEVRVTRLHVEDLKRDLRIGQEGQARHHAEMEYFAAGIERELIASRQERRELKGQVKQLTAKLTHMLEERATAWLGDQQFYASLHARRSPSPLFMGPAGAYLVDQPPPTQWVAEDISLGSAHLEDYFHRDRVRLKCNHLRPADAPVAVLQSLAGWTSSKAYMPNLLWIDGPSDYREDDLSNPVTILADSIIDMASQSKLPVMSYFCELRRGERIREGNSSETQGLVALVSSLLRQMVELLLPAFEAESDLSDERFSELDGSIRSWDKALSLFTDLAPLMPAPDTVFCIIDGLHWWDDRNTEKYVKDLVRVLRESKFKVLLTTSGRTPTLRDVILREEALLVETFDSGRDSMGLEREKLDAG
ncbi:hypothetical protein QBC43DRAFT_285639 [Cladorrhinum sp. PSN259]|nr:hypothetical protein QBC43DRAFT_285639 [Cladorrhinum sp. PSN259]